MVIARAWCTGMCVCVCVCVCVCLVSTHTHKDTHKSSLPRSVCSPPSLPPPFPLPPPSLSLIPQALGNIAERGDTAVVSGLAGALSDDDWAVQKVIYVYIRVYV